MDSDRARSLFERYKASVALVEVYDQEGDLGIGTAFHVGDGVFVTARHVVEDRSIATVATTLRGYLPLSGEDAANARTFLGPERLPVHYLAPSEFTVSSGPHFHLDDRVDVACFRVSNADPMLPAFPLGDHLDDWLGRDDFVLADGLVLGYPPVPLADQALLVAARAEINALVDRYDRPHPHFILSTLPRGGFSGAPVLIESGQILGVITSSLVADGGLAELGYLSTLTVEPIYSCLADHKCLPPAQSEPWDGIWNTKTVSLCRPRASQLDGETAIADVEVFDDGYQVYVQVRCEDAATMSEIRNFTSDLVLLPGPPDAKNVELRYLRARPKGDDIPEMRKNALKSANGLLDLLLKSGHEVCKHSSSTAFSDSERQGDVSS